MKLPGDSAPGICVPLLQKIKHWAVMLDLFLPSHKSHLLNKGLNVYPSMTWQSYDSGLKVGRSAKNACQCDTWDCSWDEWMYVIASSGNYVIWLSLLLNIFRYARMNVIVSRTSLIIASVRSSTHWNICVSE
jgi:hypothetical protein